MAKTDPVLEGAKILKEVARSAADDAAQGAKDIAAEVAKDPTNLDTAEDTAKVYRGLKESTDRGQSVDVVLRDGVGTVLGVITGVVVTPLASATPAGPAGGVAFGFVAGELVEKLYGAVYNVVINDALRRVVDGAVIQDVLTPEFRRLLETGVPIQPHESRTVSLYKSDAGTPTAIMVETRVAGGSTSYELLSGAGVPLYKTVIAPDGAAKVYNWRNEEIPGGVPLTAEAYNQTVKPAFSISLESPPLVQLKASAIGGSDALAGSISPEFQTGSSSELVYDGLSGLTGKGLAQVLDALERRRWDSASPGSKGSTAESSADDGTSGPVVPTEQPIDLPSFNPQPGVYVWMKNSAVRTTLDEKSGIRKDEYLAPHDGHVAGDQVWEIAQGGEGKLRYALSADGTWRVEMRDAADRLLEVTERFANGSVLRTDGEGKVLAWTRPAEAGVSASVEGASLGGEGMEQSGSGSTPIDPDTGVPEDRLGPSTSLDRGYADALYDALLSEFNRAREQEPAGGSTDEALQLAAAPTGAATDAAPGDAPPSASGGATTGESTPTTQGPTKVPPEATAFQAGWTLYQSIQGGDGLGIATAGVNAVNIANWYQGDKLLPKDVAPGFRTVGAGLGLASAGVGLYNSIDSGDPLGIAYSTASLAQQATQLWTGSVNSTMLALDAAGDFAGAAALYSQSASLGAVASVLGDVVPILGAALALSQGNYIGAVASILMMIPATFVIGLVLTIVSALFSGDDEPEYDWIPAAGNGSYTRGEDGAIGIEATGTNRHKSIEETPVGPGTEGASVVAGKLAAALSSLLLEVKGSQNDEDGPAALALIPERLPNLHFLGHNAFVIEFTDPHTGETRQVGANIVDVERLLVEVAHHAEALAPAWEAEQVEAKLTAGDPNAAETEAQYAHRLNPDASTDPADHAGRQTLPALVVDLAGDGITTTKLPEETGRTLADLLAGPLRYDVDSDGFLEAVEWPGLRDALLTLDRDGDGRIGNARELLASPNLPEPMRGSEMLAWLDANRDGFLDHRDPGFAALALWLDVNADAQSDPGEVLSLAQIGANALVLGPAGEADATIHLEDGASLAVEEVALDAETDGVRMAVLPGGVLVEAENGLDGQGTDARLLYVSGVADLSDPETARIWGVDPALETSRGIDTTDADASLDEAHGARASREARRIVLGGAEQGLLFAGAAGAIAALGLGVSGTAAAEELRAGRIEFVLPDGTLAPLAAPIVITEAVGRPREAGAEPPPPAHPPIVARASDVVSFPLASATTDSEPMPARSVGASPPIVVTADAITPVSSPAPTLAELTSLAELPAGGMDPFAQNVPTLFSELTGLEDDPIVLDGAELLERAGFDGDPAAVISWAGEAQHGQVVLGADGLVRFVPEANFHGTASFTYMLGGLFGRAEIVLEGVNDAPVPIGDLVAGEEDRELLFTAGALAANDRDPDIATDGDSLRVTAVGAPEHGSVELLPDGTVRFIPDADFWGEARFAYTVDDDAGASATGTAFVQLASVNDAPVAIGELIGAGVEDTALLVDPLLLTANDTDIDTPTDGDVLTVSAVFDAEHGQVALLVDGTVQFTPDANFHGLAAFGYSVSDGRGGLAQAQALVTVAGVNDAPIGVDEMVAGAEDTPLVIVPAALLANEVDPDIATDGQLLKITAVGEAEHGAVGLAPDGTVVFVPETDYWGEGAFSYTVSDGAGGFASARATVTLASVEDPPIAGADGFAGVEDATLLLDPQLLIANDRDPDGDAVHFVGVAGATHGAVSLQADGQVRFMPAPDFFGLASFDYLVADTKGNTSQGTAFVQLENVNDAPRVEAIEFGRALYAYEQITGYDSEFNYSSSIQPIYDHARALALYAAGEARNSSGTPIGASYYQSGALRPIALITEEQQYSDSEGGSYSYDDPMLSEGRVIAYDPDGDPVTFSVAAHPVHGSVAVGAGWSFNEANTWRYQSTYGDGYSGADPFVVRVTDPSGESTTFTVNTSHYGTIAGGGGDDGCCPVMVDLDADGVELVDVDDSRLLRDLDGDGWMERLGWAAEDDALLAYDADDDGFITRAEEISFVAYTPGARTDLEGLAAFDTDGDGKLTAADAEWERFHLWQDRGADGRSDPGELTPLAETGIVAISLASDGRSETRGANVIFGRSSYERADGSTGEVGDVMFAIRETGIPAGPAPPPTQNAAAEALEAHFARLALQLVSEMAAFDPKAPAELDVPPSAPPADATLAENPLQRHEQA